MFKAVTVLPLLKPAAQTELLHPDLWDNLQEYEARDPQGQQVSTIGFSKPDCFGSTPIFDCADGGRVLNVELRERVLPTSAVKKLFRERAAELSEHLGRKLNRKEGIQLREEVVASMLPTAFIKSSNVLVLVTSKYVFIGTPSIRMVDAVRILLGRAIGTDLFKQWSCLTVKWMTGLLGNDVSPFTVGSTAVLKDGTSVVRLKGVALETESVSQYLAEGFSVRELALTLDEVAFSLSENMVLRRISIKGIKHMQKTGDAAEDFDGTVAICRAALVDLVDELVRVMPSAEDDEL